MLPPHDHPVPAIETRVSPAGIVSVTVTVPLLAAVPPFATVTEYVAPTPQRWWPDWTDPLIWLLGIGFGSTNALYFGANAFLPDYLVTQGRADLIGATLAWLNGSQLITSFGLLWLAERVHRRAWPYLVFGPLSLAVLVVTLTFVFSEAWTWTPFGEMPVAVVQFVGLPCVPAASRPPPSHRSQRRSR